MELVNITLTGGALVKGPVIPVESLGRHEVCGDENDSTEHTVCDSICSNGSSITNIRPENGECSGEDCCQAMGFAYLAS
ncbi:hypothetical protein OIU77_026606, partial [Salix suchowensis]